MRQVKLSGDAEPLIEIELAFRSNKTQETTRLIMGGFDLKAIPVASPEQYVRGWQVPLGLGNPAFLESWEYVLAHPLKERTFYGFHLDSESRWLDHHAIGVDGPLFHWDADDPALLHLYLLSYERHALLNHFIAKIPSHVSAEATDPNLALP